MVTSTPFENPTEVMMGKSFFDEDIYAVTGNELRELVDFGGEAVDKAVNMALEHGLPVFGTGSFYLAAEIRKRFLS